MHLFYTDLFSERGNIYKRHVFTYINSTQSFETQFLIIHEGIIEILFSSNSLPWKMIKSGIFDHLMANNILSMNV